MLRGRVRYNLLAGRRNDPGVHAARFSYEDEITRRLHWERRLSLQNLVVPRQADLLDAAPQ